VGDSKTLSHIFENVIIWENGKRVL